MGEREAMVREYRKKPVVVEAAYHDGTEERASDIAEWIRQSGGTAYVDHSGTGQPVVDIVTLEGTMTLLTGNFCIRGVAGEYYPCDRHVFRATYEDVL